MTPGDSAEADATTRARLWRNAAQAAICDVVEPWAHGTVIRATRYPSYYNFNLVRVEDDPGLSVEGLIAVADQELAGLDHRCLDFDLADAAEPLRAGFEARGWKSERLVWMRHRGALPPGPEITVEEVPYEAVQDLRRVWHSEDWPGVELGAHEAEAREVALGRGARTLAVTDGSAPIAFAQVERAAAGAEITHVYVHPEHRGAGRGTAVTRAAVTWVGDVADLWIVADDEDRPKDLYARLGFRPAWTSTEFLRTT